MDILDEETLSARAYFSQDFEWEALRDEVERMPEFSDPHRHLSSGVHGVQQPTLKGVVTPSLLPAVGRVLDNKNIREPPSTSTSWEAFHTRHSRNLFFKERRYLTKEFPDLCQVDKALCVLEVGCGTGSSVAPIIRANKHAFVYACDCSVAALKKAAEVVVMLGESSTTSFYPFLCDISLDDLPSFLCCFVCRRQHAQLKEIGTELPVNDQGESAEQIGSGGIVDGVRFDATRTSSSDIESWDFPRSSSLGCCIGGLDIVTMIFTLSSIPVEKMAHVLMECFAVIKPGGLLLFRDYGLYDMTMLRFSPRQRVSDRLYRREDGTLSYFFTLEVVRELFTMTGLVEQELEYCCVQLVNRRKQVPMKRVWVHAKFQKPDKA